MTSAPLPGGQAGISLIETVVGMLILAVSLLALAAAAGVVAQYSVETGIRGQQVVSTSEVGALLSRTPWEELPTESECVELPGSSGLERCVTVEDVTGNRKRFTVIISGPHGADTLQVERTLGGGANPFNVP